jgi:hypothetical protein
MPRICNREGCRKRIVAKDGSPDYRKHFCGSACLKIDKRESVCKRKECGWRIGDAPIVGENQCPLLLLNSERGFRGRGVITNACVKLQQGFRGASAATVGAET